MEWLNFTKADIFVETQSKCKFCVTSLRMVGRFLSSSDMSSSSSSSSTSTDISTVWAQKTINSAWARTDNYVFIVSFYLRNVCDENLSVVFACRFAAQFVGILGSWRLCTRGFKNAWPDFNPDFYALNIKLCEEDPFCSTSYFSLTCMNAIALNIDKLYPDRQCISSMQ